VRKKVFNCRDAGAIFPTIFFPATLQLRNKMILRLFLVIAIYCQGSSRQFKPNKINHSTSPAAIWLGRKPRYMQ
jgi:hypothetical protein